MSIAGPALLEQAKGAVPRGREGIPALDQFGAARARLGGRYDPARMPTQWSQRPASRYDDDVDTEPDEILALGGGWILLALGLVLIALAFAA